MYVEMLSVALLLLSITMCGDVPDRDSVSVWLQMTFNSMIDGQPGPGAATGSPGTYKVV